VDLMGLAELERYYDTVPRATAGVEEVGPFTLFLRTREDGWDFYARPRLGLHHELTATDVDAVRAKQRELGVPESLEWVHDTTPSLAAAVRESGLPIRHAPLMVLRGDPVAAAGNAELAVLGPQDERVPAVVAAVDAGFAGSDEPGEARHVAAQRDALAGGTSVMAAALWDGEVVGGGTHAPRGGVTEIMGIAVLPRARRRGLGAALCALLAADARARGVRTVFLSAEDDAVARVYRRVGFGRVGTAMIAELGHG
jgi:ribosomal protein S18 acetylase RimI-like enzyme